MRQRVLDLLYFWVEGFYSVDFEDNQDLIDSLQNFLEESVSQSKWVNLALLLLKAKTSLYRCKQVQFAPVTTFIFDIAVRSSQLSHV